MKILHKCPPFKYARLLYILSGSGIKLFRNASFEYEKDGKLGENEMNHACKMIYQEGMKQIKRDLFNIFAFLKFAWSLFLRSTFLI